MYSHLLVCVEHVCVFLVWKILKGRVKRKRKRKRKRGVVERGKGVCISISFYYLLYFTIQSHLRVMLSDSTIPTVSKIIKPQYAHKNTVCVCVCVCVVWPPFRLKRSYRRHLHRAKILSCSSCSSSSSWSSSSSSSSSFSSLTSCSF